MPDKCRVTGLFHSEEAVVHTLDALVQTGWPVLDVHSPVPSSKIMRLLNIKKSPVGYFTLFGGIAGFLSGLGLAGYSSVQWQLMVSGKPVISLVPFFIVAFELTILFSVVANVIGFLLLTGLPRLRLPEHHDAMCSGSRFGVVAECPTEDRNALIEFFKTRGAHVG
jgi:hypothetical protein